MSAGAGARCSSFVKNVLLQNACKVRTRTNLIASYKRFIYTKSQVYQYDSVNQRSTTQNRVVELPDEQPGLADDNRKSNFQKFKETISDGPTLKDFVVKGEVGDVRSAEDTKDEPYYMEVSEYFEYFERKGVYINHSSLYFLAHLT